MKPTKEDNYQRAKKRVDDIKGFYTHLTIYIIINSILLLSAMNIFENGFVRISMPHWGYFTTPIIWGTAVLMHGLYVFAFKSSFLKQWEERKIKEYMERDTEEINKFNS
ncbi:2TM domain-containing protein [Altibacter sp. HG106]|uniref:2TM domain-containing protein n=1 Tax=Altibacter sp. HG106 TaxID=3023937 RepID=UPI0023500678|nr:2TM domain-containing protein [Altibacter sp. HG106]MDC7993816.1 2TM domain-containing protein [Altibacter sp. HG106]